MKRVEAEANFTCRGFWWEGLKNASSIGKETFSNRVSWSTGKWRNIKKNEVVFVGLITSSYRPKTFGPLFSVPMSASTTMLPDVQSAERLLPALLKIIHVLLDQALWIAGLPSSTIIKKLLPGGVQKQTVSTDCNSSNAEVTAQYTGRCHHIDWSAVIISIPQQCSN